MPFKDPQGNGIMKMNCFGGMADQWMAQRLTSQTSKTWV